eukprot:COSAG03_NODE_120_length_12312_cov_15.216900_7_plen_287_part_00
MRTLTHSHCRSPVSLCGPPPIAAPRRAASSGAARATAPGARRAAPTHPPAPAAPRPEPPPPGAPSVLPFCYKFLLLCLLAWRGPSVARAAGRALAVPSPGLCAAAASHSSRVPPALSPRAPPAHRFRRLERQSFQSLIQGSETLQSGQDCANLWGVDTLFGLSRGGWVARESHTQNRSIGQSRTWDRSSIVIQYHSILPHFIAAFLGRGVVCAPGCARATSALLMADLEELIDFGSVTVRNDTHHTLTHTCARARARARRAQCQLGRRGVDGVRECDLWAPVCGCC